MPGPVRHTRDDGARQFIPIETQLVDDLSHDSRIKPHMGADIGKHGPTIAKTHGHICMATCSNGVLASFEGAAALR